MPLPVAPSPPPDPTILNNTFDTSEDQGRVAGLAPPDKRYPISKELSLQLQFNERSLQCLYVQVRVTQLAGIGLASWLYSS